MGWYQRRVHGEYCSSQLGGTAATMIAKTIKKFLSNFYRRVEEDEENLKPPQTVSDLSHNVNPRKKEQKDDKLARGKGIHSTPPGQYPEEGPKPGKMGVIFYYLSIVLSILGIIMLCRYPLLHDHDRLKVVALGFSLIFFGLFCPVITNIIVNKENRAFVKYLDLKVEQYLATHKKNIQAIPPDGPLLDV